MLFLGKEEIFFRNLFLGSEENTTLSLHTGEKQEQKITAQQCFENSSFSREKTDKAVTAHRKLHFGQSIFDLREGRQACPPV